MLEDMFRISFCKTDLKDSQTPLINSLSTNWFGAGGSGVTATGVGGSSSTMAESLGATLASTGLDTMLGAFEEAALPAPKEYDRPYRDEAWTKGAEATETADADEALPSGVIGAIGSEGVGMVRLLPASAFEKDCWYSGGSGSKSSVTEVVGEGSFTGGSSSSPAARRRARASSSAI